MQSSCTAPDKGPARWCPSVHTPVSLQHSWKAEISNFTTQKEMVLRFSTGCDGLALAHRQMPTNFPSSAGQGEKKRMKKLIGRDRKITSQLLSQGNRLNLEKINLINCQLRFIWLVRNTDKTNTVGISDLSPLLWFPLHTIKWTRTSLRVTLALFPRQCQGKEVLLQTGPDSLQGQFSKKEQLLSLLAEIKSWWLTANCS